MIIDGHNHLLAEFVRPGELQQHPDEVPEFDLRAFDAACEELEIALVVTLVQDMNRIHGGWQGGHPLVAAFQKLRPDKVVGLAGAEPLDGNDLLNHERLEEVEGLLRDGSLRGLVLTPPYGNYYANDPCCYPFYAVAQQAGVPVFMHHSAQLAELLRAPMKYARTWLLDEVAADFPKCTFVIEHMGFPWTEELFGVMASCPNVWADISMARARPHLLAWNLTMARDYGLLDRITWGTDYVGKRVDQWMAAVKADVAWLQTELNPILKRCGWPKMTDKEMDAILRGNSARLFGLE
jgi:predicted TIM-barrel fold metal-dependent hydrolase